MSACHTPILERKVSLDASMPKYQRDWGWLTTQQRAKVCLALDKLKSSLATGQEIPGLRKKGLKKHKGVYEITWDGDGRVTFRFSGLSKPGEILILLLRVGDHTILDQAQY